MTMFYSERDLRLLDEKRVREIAREEISENQREAQKTFIRDIGGTFGPLLHVTKSDA